MKKSLNKSLIAAALSVGYVMSAHAQSSVTLYGVIDAGLIYTNNQGGHSAWQETSAATENTVFGLKGAEDLGGGLRTTGAPTSSASPPCLSRAASLLRSSWKARRSCLALCEASERTQIVASTTRTKSSMAAKRSVLIAFAQTYPDRACTVLVALSSTRTFEDFAHLLRQGYGHVRAPGVALEEADVFEGDAPRREGIAAE